MKNKVYDIIIIGGGPGGLTAAIYALRSGRCVLIVEKGMIGGQVALTNDIHNYPGFEQVTGFELSMKMHQQAQKLGADMHYAEVTDVELQNKVKQVHTTNGTVYAKSIIVSTGAKSRTLGVQGEQQLTNRGVAYCAVCDGAFFKGQTVALVGGGNSGVEDAIYLSKIAKHLFYIHKYDKFKAEKILVDEFEQVAKQNQNVTIIPTSTVSGVFGDDVVKTVEVKNYNTGKTEQHDVSALFVAIGRTPDTKFLQNKIALDSYGYIPTDEGMSTNVAGVFACGDVRVKTLRQIVTATADGAIAASSANNYLNTIAD